MKIAIIINVFPPKWIGGTEIATYSLAENLAKRSHEIHVITSFDKDFPILQYKNGFYIHRISFPKVRIIGIVLFWLNFLLKIRKIRPDIVQAQSLDIGIPALLIKKILKIPYIVWGRGDDVYLQGWFRRICSKPVLQNANAIIALTEDMQEKLAMITDHEIFIIPNGINLKKLKERSSKKIEENGVKNILFVGRLHPIKGIQYIIMAMEYVLKQIPDAKLILVGEGEEKERLEALSQQLGIYKSVQFVGIVPHEKVYTFMKQADVFVLLSLSEGFPNVILEAMACGLPIIATRVGGIPDIVKDGVNGFLVEIKRPDEVAEKILLFLQNKQIIREIGNNNQIEIEKYSWDNVAFKLENVYKNINLRKH